MAAVHGELVTSINPKDFPLVDLQKLTGLHWQGARTQIEGIYVVIEKWNRQRDLPMFRLVAQQEEGYDFVTVHEGRCYQSSDSPMAVGLILTDLWQQFLGSL